MSESSSSTPSSSYFSRLFVFFGIAVFLILKYSIPTLDFCFCLGFPTYIWLANTVCFDCNRLALSLNRPVESLARGQFRGKPSFKMYMTCFQVMTVMLPLVFIILAPLAVASEAVSPLVLLLVQVMMENSTQKFHDALRILVPIGFNAYRLKPLISWVVVAIEMLHDDEQEIIWRIFGLVLAVMNLAMWTYNLFIFLLLRVLPVYFDPEYTPAIDMAYTVMPIPKKNTSEQKKR